MSFVDLLFLENRENVPEVFQKTEFRHRTFLKFRRSSEVPNVTNPILKTLTGSPLSKEGVENNCRSTAVFDLKVDSTRLEFFHCSPLRSPLIFLFKNTTYSINNPQKGHKASGQTCPYTEIAFRDRYEQGLKFFQASKKHMGSMCVFYIGL